jgi:hypothetical protein
MRGVSMWGNVCWGWHERPDERLAFSVVRIRL